MIGQSIVNITSNGRGRLSGIATSLSLLSFVLFGSQIIEMIPLAALVGVMFMVVIETFAWDSLKLGKKVPTKDIIVIIIVAIITVLHDLALAVIIGVIISALIFAWEKGKKITARVELTDDNKKIYYLDGPLFFGSAVSFKELFNPKEDPKVVYIDFANSYISDHSAIEAINAITEKYRALGKEIHLKHLSPDCLLLLKNAEEIIEVNVLEDPKYHVADDILES
jgi:SulP family sulfate permease